MNYTEDNRKHLEFLQNTITRMNTNSFQLKGLAITLIAALFTVFATTKNILHIILILPLIVIFWFLDAYYLLQERKVRSIYQYVAGIKNDIKILPYDFPLASIKGNGCSYPESFFSGTTMGLYLPIFILVSMIILFAIFM